METIRKIIFDITGMMVEDYEKNLFSKEIGIRAVDMVYIVAKIEKNFNTKLFQKFGEKKSDIMTIHRIYELIS